MATAGIERFTSGLSHLPLIRQIGVYVGLAASIAAAAVIFMWAKEPGYGLLYGSLSERDVSEVMGALQGEGIKFRIDERTGAVLVPSDKIHDVRLKLAGRGLPKGTGGGYELLDQEKAFGTSRFLETARFQRALEGELARSIGTLSHVQGARVHLAIPKESVFVRNRPKPSASVVVNLYAGRTLEKGQVEAIVHLVAASVPNLDTGEIRVIDQRGNLLSGRGASGDFALSSSQFDFARQVEESYVKRILDLLGPLVGSDAVRAQVTAELDFTITERTEESFGSENPQVRSEQTSEDVTGPAGAGPQGVPGALTNQPPTGGTVSPVAGNPPVGAAAGGAGTTSRRATRNYELDKTISHTRQAPGAVRRLSVAVVVDDRRNASADGEVTRTPLTPEELERVTALVREAVGFQAARGDTVNVVNMSFVQAPPPEPLPEPAIWERPIVQDAGKMLLGFILLLLLFFGVLRPLFRSLVERAPAAPAYPLAVGAGGAGMAPGGFADDRLSLSGTPGVPALAGPGGAVPGMQVPGGYDQQLNTARNIASQDPKRVAQVVKTWVASDA